MAEHCIFNIFSISFTENHRNYAKMAVVTDWSDDDGLADNMAEFEKYVKFFLHI